MAQETKLKINGMHCDACVRRVRLALDNLPGVAVKDVKVGEAVVEQDPAQTDESALRSAIKEQGFTLESATSA